MLVLVLAVVTSVVAFRLATTTTTVLMLMLILVQILMLWLRWRLVQRIFTMSKSVVVPASEDFAVFREFLVSALGS